MMDNIVLKLNGQGQGSFEIEKANKVIAEMAISIQDQILTVYHTEVADELKGQGIASKLLDTMVGYARDNNLKVVALCPYVLAQFKRRPDDYADIWKK